MRLCFLDLQPRWNIRQQHISIPGDSQFNRAIFDAIPFPLFVVDDDVNIVSFNHAASLMLGDNPTIAFNTKGGEALHCIHSTGALGGCGASEACKTCLVRGSVGLSCRDQVVVRRPQRMQLVGPQGVRDIYLLITTSPLRGVDRTLVILMFQDIGELISTQGIVPVVCTVVKCATRRTDGQPWSST